MRKIFKAVCGALAAALVLPAAAGCVSQEDGGQTARYFDAFPAYGSIRNGYVQLSGMILNVDATLVLYADFGERAVYDKGKELWEYTVETLCDIEDSLSASVAASDVSAFNRAAAGQAVEIGKTCYDVLSVAMNMYERTEGCYNPAVLYSVDLYGLAPRSQAGTYPYGADGLPEQRYVDAFRRLSESFSGVVLSQNDGNYTATKPSDGYVEVDGTTYSLAVDLGGIGKGYAADLINAKMKECGFGYGMFNFGMSSMALGAHRSSEGGYWHVGLTDPFRPSSAYCRLNARDVTLSVSGTYEKYIEINGQRYCHIIDPATGSPIRTGIESCAVFGDSAAECDALTTALSAMGPDGAVRFINGKLEGSKVLFVTAGEGGEKLVYTNCPADILELTQGYTVIDVTAEKDV